VAAGDEALAAAEEESDFGGVLRECRSGDEQGEREQQGSSFHGVNIPRNSVLRAESWVLSFEPVSPQHSALSTRTMSPCSRARSRILDARRCGSFCRRGVFRAGGSFRGALVSVPSARIAGIRFRGST